MKKVIAVATMLAFTSVYAAEELQFGDVNYFLKTKQFNVSADWTQTTQKSTPGLATTRTVMKRGYQIDTRFGYGVTDRFNVYVGVDYRFDDKTEDMDAASGQKPRSFSQNGFSNPLIAANYRLLTQNEWRYNLDFGLVGRIQVQDQDLGSHDLTTLTSEDGNNASGYNSLELNSRMGRKWNEANEWQAAAGVIYNSTGDATLKGRTSNTNIDYGSSFDAYLRGTYQYRPVNEFMMLLSAQATRVGERDTDFGTSETTYRSHTDLDFRFTAKYLITDNFIAKFNLAASRNADFKQEVKGGSDVSIEKRRANFWGLGVDYLF